MSKNKVLSLILGLTVAAGVLAGCSKGTTTTPAPTTTTPAASTPAKDTPATTTPAKEEGKLVDGVYKVEYDAYDSHDYKGQLELTVSGGKITAVKYDEVKKDGSFKSQDAAYKKTMEAQTKTYPEKAYNELKQSLLTKQSANVDTVTGATQATDNFKGLAKYAIEEMAKKGVTTPAKIKAAK